MREVKGRSINVTPKKFSKLISCKSSSSFTLSKWLLSLFYRIPKTNSIVEQSKGGTISSTHSPHHRMRLTSFFHTFILLTKRSSSTLQKHEVMMMMKWMCVWVVEVHPCVLKPIALSIMPIVHCQKPMCSLSTPISFRISTPANIHYVKLHCKWEGEGKFLLQSFSWNFKFPIILLLQI